MDDQQQLITSRQNKIQSKNRLPFAVLCMYFVFMLLLALLMTHILYASAVNNSDSIESRADSQSVINPADSTPYVNNTYKYTFRYPKTWYVIPYKLPNPPHAVEFGSRYVDKNFEIDGDYLVVSVQPYTSTLETLFKSKAQSQKNISDGIETKVADLTLHGDTAIEAVIQNDHQDKLYKTAHKHYEYKQQDSYLVKHGSLVVVFDFRTYSEHVKEAKTRYYTDIVNSLNFF